MADVTTRLRRSPRLMAGADNDNSKKRLISSKNVVEEPKVKRQTRSKKKNKNDQPPKKESNNTKKLVEKKPSLNQSLPRTRQLQIETETHNNVAVMGIDEAGRGPLAGPVVAAAVIIPSDVDGIVDSKKLTKEEVREELYHKILASPNLRWAVAVINAQVIDEINILQATLLAMQRACTAVVNMDKNNNNNNNKHNQSSLPSHIEDSYTISSSNNKDGNPLFFNQEILSDCSKLTETYDKSKLHSDVHSTSIDRFYALVDGNRLPPNMPVEGAEPIVKGDGKEYCIAAASIIAKVTRDNIMAKYDAMYPEYDFKKHKGYPTAAHVDAIYKQNKISPIHRKSYAPLKHLEFDTDGTVLGKKDIDK